MNLAITQLVLKQRQRLSLVPLTLPIGPVDIRARRNDLLEFLYQTGIVEACDYSAFLSNKLFFAKFLELGSPEAYLKFHPRTESLTAYLNGREPRDAIAKDFSSGFVVKPASSMNSDGDNIYVDDDFFTSYKESPSKFLEAEDSFVIQEMLGTKAQEYRLHTLARKVIRGATYTRWDQPWDQETFSFAESVVQEFLDELPECMTYRQAWSFDLMGSRETGFKIVEVNTNRGKRGHWSGDLEIPDTLAAYARHLENEFGVRFLGEEGRKLLSGLGNKEKFLEKFGPEAVQRHHALRATLR